MRTLPCVPFPQVHAHAHVMMSTQKVIELERAQSANEQPGSFGFSIMGGYGTKFPSCICEVDTGGPADQTKKVGVAWWVWSPS